MGADGIMNIESLIEIAEAMGSDVCAMLPLSDGEITISKTDLRLQKVMQEGREYFSLPLLRRRALVVCGLGFVGYYVCKIAQLLGFEVYGIDDRSEFADASKLPECNILCGDFSYMLDSVPHERDTSFVIVTRGHKADRLCLEQIINRPFGYLGMIGSNAKVAATMRSMEEAGFDVGLLDKVHAPIGLKIGARTPAEIAVAIVAEVIAEMGSEGGVDADVEKAIRRMDVSALITIIDAQGSVPRGRGSMMALTKDGSPVGTIGGGAVEARAIELAHRQKNAASVEKLDLTDAGDLGMVCGGKVEVLINKLEGKTAQKGQNG